MDLREHLMKEHSKENALKVVKWIGKDPVRFHTLINLFLSPEYRICQRAAFVLHHSFETYPHLIQPYLDRLINNLYREGLHDAVKRNTVRILQFVDIPEELMGKAADICFRYLSSPEEAIAIRVFSMTVVYRISKVYPDLQNELKLMINDLLPYASAGLANRANKILSRI